MNDRTTVTVNQSLWFGVMNRYVIEKRDREVVEKFRAVVESKERLKKRNRLRLAGVFLVILCAGLIILYKNFSSPVVSQSVSHRSNTIALNSKMVETPSLHPEEHPGPVESTPAEIAAVDPDVNDQLPVHDMPDIQAVEPVIWEKKAAPEPVPVLAPRVKTPAKIGLSEVSEQISPATDIRIAEITTCESVENRQPVSRKNEFSLQLETTPYVWMDVRSKKTPYKLRHVYYLNDRRYCEVPLAIVYPRMRTWSNVTLRHPYEAGQWRVDVVTQKGEILSQVQFSVIP